MPPRPMDWPGTAATRAATLRSRGARRERPESPWPGRRAGRRSRVRRPGATPIRPSAGVRPTASARMVVRVPGALSDALREQVGEAGRTSCAAGTPRPGAASPWRGQPVAEVLPAARDAPHVRGDDVQEMLGQRRRVGDATRQAIVALDDHVWPGRLGPEQVNGGERPGRAAADDCDLRHRPADDLDREPWAVPDRVRVLSRAAVWLRPARAGAGVRRRRPRCGWSSRSCAGCCSRGWRRCAR